MLHPQQQPSDAFDAAMRRVRDEHLARANGGPSYVAVVDLPDGASRIIHGLDPLYLGTYVQAHYPEGYLVGVYELATVQ